MTIRALTAAELRSIADLEERVGRRYQGFAEEPSGRIRVDVDGTPGFHGSTLRQALRRATDAARGTGGRP